MISMGLLSLPSTRPGCDLQRPSPGSRCRGPGVSPAARPQPRCPASQLPALGRSPCRHAACSGWSIGSWGAEEQSRACFVHACPSAQRCGDAVESKSRTHQLSACIAGGQRQLPGSAITQAAVACVQEAGSARGEPAAACCLLPDPHCTLPAACLAAGAVAPGSSH